MSLDSDHSAAKIAPHMTKLRFLLLLLAIPSALQAHDKHPAPKNYVPPKEPVVIGEGDFRYRLVPGWATQNGGKYKLGNCNAIAQDSRGRILLLHTSKEHCLIALSPEGKVLDAWGDFTVAAHGLSVVKEKDREVLFISDHSAGGKVYKTTLDGVILMTVGCPMESGLYKDAKEFKPAKTLHLPNGEFFVIDGYGKDYIHRYSADGKWKSAFGGNIGAGEAQLKHWGPHGGVIDFSNPKDPVMILALSDQQKMKRFKLDGTWLETKEFPGSNPRDVLFHRDHLFVHHLGDNWPKDRNAPGYISVLDRNLKVVANLGGTTPNYSEEGKLDRMSHTTHVFHHLHGMCVDDNGNLYVAQAASNGTWPLKLEPVVPRTWFVSSKGNDSHEGSEEKPLRTISEGARRAQPGDTVLVKQGVYRERVTPPRGGEEGKPITYRGEKLGKVFLRGSEEWKPGWKKHKAGVRFAVPDEALFDDDVYVDSPNPFKAELSSTPEGRDGKWEFERYEKGDPDMVYTCGQFIVNGKPWRQRPYLSEVEAEEQTWTYDAKSGRVYVNFGSLDPTKNLVEITTRRRLFCPHIWGLGHIVVEGFVMEHCGNNYATNFWNTPKWAQAGALGLRGGHHWIIRNNVIRHVNTVAMDIGRGGNDNERDPVRVSGPMGEDIVVENNYLLDNGAAGVIGSGTQRLVVRGNVILRNNTHRFIGKKRWEQAGIKFHYVNNAIIEKNYVGDNPRNEGIWLDNQFSGTRVTRNVVVNNGQRGIFVEMSDYKFDAVVIDHNISIGNEGSQFYVHDASGSTALHNLFANSPPDAKYGQGLYVRQVNPRTKTGYHSMFNNLLIKHKAMLDINYPAHRGGPQRFDHNVYDVAANARSFLINRESDHPSPWEPKEFFELVSADVGQEGPKALHGGAKVALTLPEWRAFWKKHGLENDRHSVTRPGITVSYDADTQKLTVDVPFEISDLRSRVHPGVTRDYFGKILRGEKALPGPFQNLKKGKNVIKIWDGLPLLKEGELPN